MKKALKTIVCLAVFSTLAACGGDSSAPPPATATVTTPSVTAPINASSVGAVVALPFTFADGVPAFGTTGSTKVTFTGTGATPAFNITSAEGTATGATTIGSCTFKVITSTYPATFPLATGKEVKVDPCDIKVSTLNAVANGTATSSSISLVLGVLKSLDSSISITVATDGSVTISGTNIGTVTVKIVTGGN